MKKCEWKGWEIGNLPSDILVGKYEIQIYDGFGDWYIAQSWENANTTSERLNALIGFTHGRYRYRKTEPDEQGPKNELPLEQQRTIQQIRKLKIENDKALGNLVSKTAIREVLETIATGLEKLYN